MNQKITFDHINETDLLGNYFEADSLYVGTREVAYQQFVNEFGGGQQGDQAQEGTFINNLISKYNSLGSFGKILLLSAGLVLTALVLGSLAIFASQYDGPYSKILGIREDSNQNSVNRDLSDSRNSNDKKVENYQDCLKYGSVVGSLCFYEDKTFGSDEEDKNGDLEPKDILDLEQEDFSTRPGSAVEGFNSDSDNSLNLQVDSNPGINRNFPDSPESNESKPRQNLPDGDQPPDQNGNNNDDSGNQDDNPDDESEETKTCYQFYGNFSLEVPEDWKCESPEERNLPAEDITDSIEQREYLIATNGKDKIEVINTKNNIYEECTHEKLVSNMESGYGPAPLYYYIFTSCNENQLIYGYPKSNDYYYPRVYVQAEDFKENLIRTILKSFTFEEEYPEIKDDNPDDEPEETKTCYQFYGNFSLEVPEDWKCESPEERNLPAEDITDSIEQREYLIATNGKDKIEVINKKFDVRDKIYLSCSHRDLLKNRKKSFGGSKYYYKIVTECNGQRLIYGYGKKKYYSFYPRIFVQTEKDSDKTIKKILKSIDFHKDYPED
jgi:hypothetical protein